MYDSVTYYRTLFFQQSVFWHDTDCPNYLENAPLEKETHLDNRHIIKATIQKTMQIANIDVWKDHSQHLITFVVLKIALYFQT